MVDVSGIPNMGFGGGGYFGGSAALGQPAMSAAQINQGIWGGYSPGAAQATQANIYGAGGFGAQPAYYAGLGAAYGRATGGFGGYSPGGYPSGSVERGEDLPAPAWVDPFSGGYAGGGGDIWSRGASAFNPYGGGANPGGFSPSPNYTGGTQQPAIDMSGYFTALTGGRQQANPYAGVGAGFNPYSASTYGLGTSWQQPSMPSSQRLLGYTPGAQWGGQDGGGSTAGAFDGTSWMYNSGTYAGDQGNYGIPYNGRPVAGDIGYSRQPSYPNLGYNPGMENLFANPAMGGGAFQGRFGMGFPNAGTPSQYYTGSAALPGMMPPGFAGNYGADNPSGALPLGSRFNPYGNAFNQ